MICTSLNILMKFRFKTQAMQEVFERNRSLAMLSICFEPHSLPLCPLVSCGASVLVGSCLWWPALLWPFGAKCRASFEPTSRGQLCGQSRQSRQSFHCCWFQNVTGQRDLLGRWLQRAASSSWKGDIQAASSFASCKDQHFSSRLLTFSGTSLFLTLA